jgi:hypothetical protein
MAPNQGNADFELANTSQPAQKTSGSPPQFQNASLFFKIKLSNDIPS